MDTYSKDWQELTDKINERLGILYKSLKFGNKHNQYADTAERYENIGFIHALEWVLKLPENQG